MSTPEQVSREIAQCSDYLRTRFFPPLDSRLAPYVVEAVHACNRGEYDAWVWIHAHVETTPSAAVWDEAAAAWHVEAAELVRVTRLQHMIEADAD